MDDRLLDHTYRATPPPGRPSQSLPEYRVTINGDGTVRTFQFEMCLSDDCDIDIIAAEIACQVFHRLRLG
jgi:hypothetical protein